MCIHLLEKMTNIQLLEMLSLSRINRRQKDCRQQQQWELISWVRLATVILNHEFYLWNKVNVINSKWNEHEHSFQWMNRKPLVIENPVDNRKRSKTNCLPCMAILSFSVKMKMPNKIGRKWKWKKYKILGWIQASKSSISYRQ